MARVNDASGPFPQTATLPLNFIIVGGSIAGLACAYNLQKAGHKVRVLEKDDAVGTVCFFFHQACLCVWLIYVSVDRWCAQSS